MLDNLKYPYKKAKSTIFSKTTLIYFVLGRIFLDFVIHWPTPHATILDSIIALVIMYIVAFPIFFIFEVLKVKK